MKNVSDGELHTWTDMIVEVARHAWTCLRGVWGFRKPKLQTI